MSDDVGRSFDAIAEAYADAFVDELSRKPFDRELLTRFASALPARATVLDIGTGAAGHIGRFMADRGFAVTGVDLSAGVVAVARRLNPGMTFVAADFRDLPQADDSIDAVVAFYVYIYGTDDDILGGLAESRRVLKPSGRLLAAVHGALDDQPRLETFADFQGTPVDITMRHSSPATFAGLAERAGLRLDALHVRAPYDFEHASRRIYLEASAP